ncbi:hypothetical protein [Ferruginibacter sp.]|uniref:hypothetical protein n=1 Tax=Ferruginibacter sp. TaxID=1940288 RepID=UPI001992B57C|nr:hypothetical protein [Ferruginibacter sp.]MBC7629098.1 hypothetical protein [Ferruginibacter sp.]
MKPQFSNWIVGWDVCQGVCPWNRFSKPTSEIELTCHPQTLHFTKADLQEITEDYFKKKQILGYQNKPSFF